MRALASFVTIMFLWQAMISAECVTFRMPTRRPLPPPVQMNFQVSGAFCGEVFVGADYVGHRSEVLANAGFEAYSLIDKTVYEIATDEYGRFAAAGLRAGRYRLGLPGFVTTGATIEIVEEGLSDCTRPLFVSLMLAGECPTESAIAENRPDNVGPDPTPPEAVRARSEAEAEVHVGNSFETDLPEAERHYREAIRIDPTFWVPHVNLAVTLEQRRQDAEAEEEYRQAARLAPESEIPYWKLSSFLIDRGRLADARTALQQAASRGIESAGVRAGLGLLAFAEERWQDAENQFWDALESPVSEAIFGFENDMQWYTFVTIAIGKQGRTDEAAENEGLLRARFGDEPWMLNMLGMHHVTAGTQLPEAEQMLQKAVDAEPANLAYLTNLAWANFKMGRFHDAAERLEKVAGMSGNRPEVLERLAEVYLAAGRQRDARNALVFALEGAVDPVERQRLSERLENLK